jgi:alkylation response protein AidB-like acyl-CoA dehydrogenase
VAAVREIAVSQPPPVVERTLALVPRLAESAAATEQARRLPPAHFDALAEAGVFRMTAPRKFGGDEVDFQTQCDVLAHVARGCPSSSWVATIFSAMSWLAATFPDEAQEEILGSRDPRISGVFSPTGTATPADGGYRVSGRWGFNTGGQGSFWTVVNAVLGSGSEAMPSSPASSRGSTTGMPAGWPAPAATPWWRRTSSCLRGARSPCP